MKILLKMIMGVWIILHLAGISYHRVISYLARFNIRFHRWKPMIFRKFPFFLNIELILILYVVQTTFHLLNYWFCSNSYLEAIGNLDILFVMRNDSVFGLIFLWKFTSDFPVRSGNDCDCRLVLWYVEPMRMINWGFF